MGGYHQDSGRENPSSVDISGRELTQAIYVSQEKHHAGTLYLSQAPPRALSISQKKTPTGSSQKKLLLTKEKKVAILFKIHGHRCRYTK